MYLECEHDIDGNIIGNLRYDSNLPMNPLEKMFWRKHGLPDGLLQSRIDIDIITAMEIEQNCGKKAIINSKGEPEIINIKKADFIKKNFKVDMSQEIPIPENIKFPQGLKLRKLIKK